MSRIILGTAALMPCMMVGGYAFGQARITENQKTSIYVDRGAGSDLNAGITADKPFATIQTAVNKAIAYAKAGIGTKVEINPGIYRETVSLNYASKVPVTIEASTPGTVFIDGADVLANGSPIGGGVYAYSWKDTVGGCALPSGWYTGMPPIVQANEMIFVNGKLMTQVMSSSQLRPGTAYFDTTSDQVQVYPPSGTNLGTAQIEVASRQSTLAIGGASDIVFRGLAFEHAAACLNETGATVNSSSNILFDNDTANWNNWGGLGVNTSTNITVENTIADFNGGPGLSGWEDVDSSWQNNETDYNNWRGAMVGLYDFADGGLKLMRAHTATVSGQKSYNNQAQGLWFDTDNINITVSGVTLVGNLVGNLQLEASQGPFTVENSAFCSGGGIQFLNAGGVAMTGNNFYSDGGLDFQNGQIFLGGKAGGREVTNWQTGETTLVFTKDMKLENNSSVAVGSNEYVFNTYTSGNDWSEYIDSLTSNDNHWYDASKTTAFGLPDGRSTNLAGWRSLSGQDADSSWSLPDNASSRCGVPSTSYPDFQLLAHNAASYVSGYTMNGGTITIPLQVRNFNYGTVTLYASGLPSGVTASFSSSSLSSGNTNMTLHASPSAAHQTVPITIFGVSGSRVHTVTLKVSVRPS
jgi:Right handed beta helix region